MERRPNKRRASWFDIGPPQPKRQRLRPPYILSELDMAIMAMIEHLKNNPPQTVAPIPPPPPPSPPPVKKTPVAPSPVGVNLSILRELLEKAQNGELKDSTTDTTQ